MGYTVLKGVMAHGPETRSPATLLILHAYALRADDQTAMAYLSRNRLARIAKTNQRVVRRSIKELEEKGFLIDTGLYAPGPQGKSPKIYQVVFSCNSLCFRDPINDHYPEGAQDMSYPPLYPGVGLEIELGYAENQ